LSGITTSTVERALKKARDLFDTDPQGAARSALLVLMRQDPEDRVVGYFRKLVPFEAAADKGLADLEQVIINF
jgi:hypothetical protein